MSQKRLIDPNKMSYVYTTIAFLKISESSHRLMSAYESVCMYLRHCFVFLSKRCRPMDDFRDECIDVLTGLIYC